MLNRDDLLEGGSTSKMASLLTWLVHGLRWLKVELRRLKFELSLDSPIMPTCGLFSMKD